MAYKISKIDEGGYKVHRDGELYTVLQPYLREYYLEIDLVRIQQVDEFLSICGFAHLPLATFRTADENVSDGYCPPETKYTNVSILPAYQDDEEDAKLNAPYGTLRLTKSSVDISGHLRVEIIDEDFQNLYDLIKTKQLTSLSLNIFFFDKGRERKDVVFFKEQRMETIENKELHFDKTPEAYAIEEYASVSGVVRKMSFATKPFHLDKRGWGYYSLDSDLSFSYEEYLNNISKNKSKWNSLSFFQKSVISLLALIAFMLVIIRFII